MNNKIFFNSERKELAKHMPLVAHLALKDTKINDSKAKKVFSKIHNNKNFITKTYAKIITPIIEINNF